MTLFHMLEPLVSFQLTQSVTWTNEIRHVIRQNGVRLARHITVFCHHISLHIHVFYEFLLLAKRLLGFLFSNCFLHMFLALIFQCLFTFTTMEICFNLYLVLFCSLWVQWERQQINPNKSIKACTKICILAPTCTMNLFKMKLLLCSPGWKELPVFCVINALPWNWTNWVHASYDTRVTLVWEFFSFCT